MSFTPPSEPPSASYGEPQHQANSPKGGCMRAMAILLVLGVAFLIFAGVFSRVAGDYAPIMGDTVAVVRIEGSITDSRDYVKIIRKLRESNFVKAIVLRLDTPGGGVGASEEIYREALKARTENDKVLVASMGSVAASGGYYIASAADRIFANSGTITGSIGVIAPDFNVQGALDKLGIRQQSLKSGEHKDSGSPFTEMKPTERVMLQSVINDMYRQFFQIVLRARAEAIGAAAENMEQFEGVLVSAATKAPDSGVEWSAFTTGTVAAALKVPVETETLLRRIADGRIYSGDQALKLGLIDTIGTLEDAIAHAAEKADLGDDPNIVERAPKSDLPGWLGTSARRFLNESLRPEVSLEYRVW